MKKRWLFLLLIIAGALLIVSQYPPHIDVAPFPASPAEKVRLELPVRLAGDYRVEVSMPKIDNKLGLGEETFPCDFLVSIEYGGHQIVSRHVDSISTASEFGWANIQTFIAGENFHLSHGTYDVTVTSGSACQVAATKGASITVGRFEREHILGSLLVDLLSIALLLVGVVGLMFSEFVRRPNQLLKNDAPERHAS